MTADRTPQDYPAWQSRVAYALLALVLLGYACCTALHIGGWFEHREFAFTDTAAFRYIGWRMAHGAGLYADLWDNKGPLVFLTYYGGYLLTPDSDLGLELLIFAYSAVATLCAYQAFRALAAPLPAACLVLLLSLTLGFIGWCGTTTESTYGLLCLVGLALLPRSTASTPGRYMCCAVPGVLVALSLLCKANYAGFACFLAVYWGVEAYRQRHAGLWLRTMGCCALGGIATLGLCCGVLAARGSLPAMWDASVLFNIAEYHESAPEWAQFPSLPPLLAEGATRLCAEFQYAKHFLHVYPAMGLLLIASVTVLFRHRRAIHGRHVAWVGGTLAWLVAEFASGGLKFLIYNHYYATLFIPIALLAAAAITCLTQAKWRWGFLVLIGAVAVFESGPWHYLQPHGKASAMEAEQLTATMQRLNPRCKPVAVLGAQASMHALTAARMYMPQRYIHNALVLDYDITPARRAELSAELKAALDSAAQESFLLTEEPLEHYTARHPELLPLVQGWRLIHAQPGLPCHIYGHRASAEP